MKKSELKNYIRENIISTLSEDTEEEIAKTKELTAAIQDLEAAKKDAGIEEKVAKTVDDVIDPADYSLIGSGYLSGFSRPHSLDADQLETLGRKIVKQLYKGDFDKAKAKFIKEDATPKGEDFFYDYLDIGMSYLEGFGKKHSLDDNQLEKLGKKIVDQLYKGDVGKAYDAIVKRGAMNEDEDKEPSDAEIKKNKSLAKAAEELALLTREMKSLAKKYSKAEGGEKEKLVKVLKDKTKLKKELESILDK